MKDETTLIKNDKMKYATTLINIHLNGGKTPNSAQKNDDNEKFACRGNSV